MTARHRIAAYAWAGPNTLLGVVAGLVVLVLGGRLRVVRGVLEFDGGWFGKLMNCAPPFSIGAITFGHVILGINGSELDAARLHEHVHVAQYEAWGPLFLPAYAASSLWQVLRGRRAYRDNFFERKAFAVRPDTRATA